MVNAAAAGECAPVPSLLAQPAIVTSTSGCGVRRVGRGVQSREPGAVFTSTVGAGPPMQELKAEGLLATPEQPEPATVTAAQLLNLKVLDAVCHESLRLFPPVPSAARMITQDTQVRGYHCTPHACTVRAWHELASWFGGQRSQHMQRAINRCPGIRSQEGGLVWPEGVRVDAGCRPFPVSGAGGRAPLATLHAMSAPPMKWQPPDYHWLRCSMPG